MPSPPSVDGSDSIHPEAYAGVSAEPAAVGPGLADREGVSRELIASCEAGLASEKDASRRARLHYECARLYEVPLGELDAALEHYQQARALRPHHLPSVSGLRRVRLLQQDWSAAIKVIADEIELSESPEARGALFYLRAVLLEQQLGHVREARESYQAALEQLPGDAAALRAMARAHRREGEHGPLRRVLDAQAGVAAEDRSLAAARWAERGRDTELFSGKGEEPCSYYQRSANADPMASGSLFHATRLYGLRNQFAEIARLEQQRIELLTDARLRSVSRAALADLLSERLDDLAGAITQLERAVAEFPEDAASLERLAELYERTGDHEGRVRTLERLVESTRDVRQELELCLTLADLHRVRRRDLACAAQWLERAQTLDPKDPLTADALAELHRENNDWQAVAAVLERREANSDDLELRAALLEELAEIHERRLGGSERAVEFHRSVLSLRPGHESALSNLCRLLRGQGRYAELVELHERVVEQSADDAEAISHLLEAALIYEDLLHEPEAALSAFRRVLERDDAHLAALRGAQRLAEVTGDAALAVQLIEQELTLARGNERRVALLLRAADVCERGLHDEAKALTILQEVLALDERNRPALAAAQRLHRRAGRVGELVQVLLQEAQCLDNPQKHAEYLVSVARIVDEQLADKQRALDLYRSAYEEWASDTTALPLERALAGAERFEELAQLLEERQSCAEVPRAQYRVARELARVREARLGQSERALAAHDAALVAQPDSLAARLGRVRCLGQLGRFEELVEELDRVRGQISDPAARVWCLLLTGELLEGEVTDLPGAAERFEQVLERIPDHRGALLALERLYQALGRPEEQVRVLQKQVEGFHAVPEQVAALRELSRLSTHYENPEELRTMAASGVLQRLNDDVRALFELEFGSMSRKDLSRLAQVDARWVGRAPPGPVRAASRTRLAEYLEAHSPREALEQHEPALAEDAENIAAARGITRLAETVGDVGLLRRAAESEYSVVGNAERAASLLRSAARSERAQGHLTQATEILTRALSLWPDDVSSAAELHALMTELGQQDKLITVLSVAAEAAENPEVRAGHWISVARLLAGARADLGAGIAALSRVALAQPGHAAVLLELAELYIRDRQWGPAAERLNKALQNAPDAAAATPARLRLAELYHEHLDRTSDAAALLREIVKQVPDEPRALRRLLAIEIETGDSGAESTAQLWTRRAQGSERAEAFTTLGRLQRDAGKLEEAKRSLAQAVALVGLSPAGADRDLVRMLEKEQLAGKSPDWSIYAGALSSFCASDAGVTAKLSALHEASAILIDRMNKREQGYGALRAGLTVKPRDFDLQEQLARRLLEAKQYERALPELFNLLALDPGRLQTWSDLCRSFDSLGRNAEANLAMGPLVALGGGTDLERAAWSARVPRFGALAAGSVDESVLQQAARGNGLADGVRALFVQLGTLAPKLVDVGPERYGLSAKERVGGPLAPLLERITRIFNLAEVDLYLAVGEPRVGAVLGEPVGIVVPETFQKLSEPQQVFCLARQATNIALGTHLVAALGPGQTLLFVAAAASLVGVEFGAATFGSEQIADVARRLTKALPWLSKGRFEEAARRAVADLPTEMSSLLAELDRASLRLAMIVSDDLSCLHLVKEHGASLLGLDRQSIAATLEDLLRFWVSEQAMTIRRQIGLA